MKEDAFDLDDPRFRMTPFQQMISSCTGAVLTSLFMTPLDVVKTRLQAQQRVQTKCLLYCNGLIDNICSCGPLLNKHFNKLDKAPIRYNGTIDTFTKLWRYEGGAALWSGLGPTMVLSLPATIIYFVTYEQMRLTLKDWSNKKLEPGKQQVLPFWVPPVSGASARMCSAIFISPLELVRTKMQSTKMTYKELGDALRQTMKLNGFLVLWRGLLPTLLRDIPFSAIYWLNYENIKRMYGPSVPSFTFSFIAGGLSGSLAAMITTPFDVVKTHQQIELDSRNTGKLEQTSTLKSLNSIYKMSGVRGLFAGLVPRVSKVAPACAIMIATFEYSKYFFYRYNESNREKQVEMIVQPKIDANKIDLSLSNDNFPSSEDSEVLKS